MKKKEFDHPSYLVIKGERYDVGIKEFSKKNSSVVVKGSLIEVRLSSRISFFQKQNHITQLLDSITKKLERKKPEISFSFNEILSRGYFYCGGVLFRIETQQGNRVYLLNNIFYIGINSGIESIKKRIENHLINKFRDEIIKRVEYINSISFQYRYGAVEIKNISSKWGHCTSKNDLLFNIKLINAPQEILDYVIYHELAHIRVKNHSSAFWREVERYCPNHKELRKTLKHNPPNLFNYEY